MCVLILEDDPGRVRAMRGILADLLPGVGVVVFDNAADAIAFLGERWGEVVLISLDHDLGPARVRDGVAVDPGDGRDVAAFLATCGPACPAIVHSANYQMVPVMIEVLRDAGWAATMVTPYSQLEHGWIDREWRGEVEWLIAKGRVRC